MVTVLAEFRPPSVSEEEDDELELFSAAVDSLSVALPSFSVPLPSSSFGLSYSIKTIESYSSGICEHRKNPSS